MPIFRGYLTIVSVIVLMLLAGLTVHAQEPAPAAEPARAIDFRDPIQIMKLGGWAMWPILVCSIVAVAIALERLVSLRRGRVLPRRFLRPFFLDLEAGQLTRDTALARCQKNGSPAALIIQSAVRRWGRPMAEIEQAINEGGAREVIALRHYLRGLHSTANLAMLLGLLGTVLGIISAFNQMSIASGQAKAELLSSGISEALIATASGLAVAISALFLHSIFSSRVERLVYELDRVALAVAERISAESGAINAEELKQEPTPTTLPVDRGEENHPSPPQRRVFKKT